MKKNLLICLAFSCCVAKAQDYLGFVNSNYAGITSAVINPANIVDSRMLFDLTLFGMNTNAANNYVGLKRSALKSDGRFFDAVTARNGASFPAFADSLFQEKYLTHVLNGKDKSVFASTRVTLPSFMVNINPRNAIGLSINARAYSTIDGVGEELASLLYADIGRNQAYGVQDLIGKNIKNKFLSGNSMAWVEYGLTYAHVFKEEGKHFFKAGVTPKLLQGIAAAYMNIRDLEFRFDNDAVSINNDSLQLLAIAKTEVSYAHSENLEFPTGTAPNRFQNNQSNDPTVYNTVDGYPKFSYPGFGIDLGVVYEYRPNWKNYKYDMDGQTNLWRKEKSKYKLRVGASVLDLGQIKFPKGQYSTDFKIDVDTIRYRLLETGEYPVYDFDKMLDSLAEFQESPDEFKMALPTAISLQVDYNIWNDFYVNLTPYFALLRKEREAKVHDLTVVSLAPRYDHKWFGVSIPVSYNSFYAKAEQPVKFGAMVRLGPILVGTNDIASYTSGTVFGANFYFMLKLPIPYNRVRDRDHDNISDKKDKCRDVPGTWEFVGCPDRDGDHIRDNEDACPDAAGLKEFQGCPDLDLDGITDAKDSCPEVKGLVEFNGCPDTDNDKIIDRLDACPLVAGPAEFNGCPDRDADGTQDNEDLCPDMFGPKEYKGCPDRDADSIVDSEDDCPEQFGPRENKGCPYPDADKDGIFDKDDDCPQVFGVPELRGCPKPMEQKDPVAQTVPMKAAEKKIIEKAFATLEFATAKDVIKPKSYPGLNDLAKLMIQHKEDWKLKLAGHTDNEGIAQKNMALSEKRAKAVKNYLVKKGVADEQIITEWFGQTQPIADNKTPKGRQKNRRVEMKIIAKE